MEQNSIVHLDLTGCKYLGELHQRIKEAFDFPDYYGENWHAFRDSFITVGIPQKIVIHGENTIPKSLQSNITQMHKELDRIYEEFQCYGWDFEYEVAD